MRLSRIIGLAALGYALTLGLAFLGAVLWGNHIEHRIDTAVIERHSDHRLIKRLAVGGGDALQPANAGQQPSLGQGAGHQATPKGDKHHHTAPHSSGPKAADPGDEPEGTSPTATTGSSAGQDESADQEADEDGEAEGATATTSPGVIGNPGGQLGDTVCAAGEVVKELAGIQVCSPK